jgi:hypothetical protein
MHAYIHTCLKMLHANALYGLGKACMVVAQVATLQTLQTLQTLLSLLSRLSYTIVENIG